MAADRSLLRANTSGPSWVEFTVPGRPQPRGSKRVFINKKTGKPIVTDDNPKSKGWMGVATEHAEQAMTGRDLYHGPVRLVVTFHIGRPKGHYRTGRNKDILKDAAPVWHITPPDSTKLLRGLEDALSGVVWRDDSQVVMQHVSKVFGWPERTEVRVEPVAASASFLREAA